MRMQSKSPDGSSSIRWPALLDGVDPRFLQEAPFCSAERGELLVNLFQLRQISIFFTPKFFGRGERLPSLA